MTFICSPRRRGSRRCRPSPSTSQKAPNLPWPHDGSRRLGLPGCARTEACWTSRRMTCGSIQPRRGSCWRRPARICMGISSPTWCRERTDGRPRCTSPASRAMPRRSPRCAPVISPARTGSWWTTCGRSSSTSSWPKICCSSRVPRFSTSSQDRCATRRSCDQGPPPSSKRSRRPIFSSYRWTGTGSGTDTFKCSGRSCAMSSIATTLPPPEFSSCGPQIGARRTDSSTARSGMHS